ncbi:TonB-dependent receptor plug domain-containing protein, partial [Enterobacter hormaechei]|uniref:TonB-dependent receptor plug domain-containing protein n=1 Tax=Enterobacter hormaechei TaxID=158836 RepID=UPI00203DE279
IGLRGLSQKNTLVLLNGRRLANYGFPAGGLSDTFVDLNALPLVAVERIEVLKDGASAVYGSDAVAGVVNIITRRDFDGGQVTLNYGEYSKGDGTQKGVDLAWGKSGDRFSLFLGASWTKQDPVFAKDR